MYIVRGSYEGPRSKGLAFLPVIPTPGRRRTVRGGGSARALPFTPQSLSCPRAFRSQDQDRDPRDATRRMPLAKCASTYATCVYFLGSLTWPGRLEIRHDNCTLVHVLIRTTNQFVTVQFQWPTNEFIMDYVKLTWLGIVRTLCLDDDVSLTLSY